MSDRSTIPALAGEVAHSSTARSLCSPALAELRRNVHRNDTWHSTAAFRDRGATTVRYRDAREAPDTCHMCRAASHPLSCRADRTLHDTRGCSHRATRKFILLCLWTYCLRRLASCASGDEPSMAACQRLVEALGVANRVAGRVPFVGQLD